MVQSDFQKRLMDIQSNLFSFAMKLTSNYDDAHDLLQDTTCKALVNEEKYVDDSNFKSWVFTIMRNIFINNYRRVVRTQTVVDKTEDLYQLNLNQLESSETSDNSYAMSEVTSVVESLQEEYRVPFVMHISGYKYQEIAEQMHLPLGTVKSRIFFAKQKLQSELKEYR